MPWWWMSIHTCDVCLFSVVFGVMREFVLEVEEALALQPEWVTTVGVEYNNMLNVLRCTHTHTHTHCYISDHCSLYTFLHELVEQDFLDRVRFDNLNKMTNCSKRKAQPYWPYCVIYVKITSLSHFYSWVSKISSVRPEDSPSDWLQAVCTECE